MKDRNIVRLQILSASQTPESISALLGIPCDKCWHLGDMVGSTLVRQKTHGWELRSSLPESASVQEQLCHLLKRVQGATESLRTLSDEAKIVVSCVVYCTQQPNLYLDFQIVHGIDSLAADLDFDIYWTD